MTVSLTPRLLHILCRLNRQHATQQSDTHSKLEAKAANAKEIAVTVAGIAPRLERGLAPTVQLYSAEKSKPEQLTPILCFRVYLKASMRVAYMLNINGMLHPISPCLLGVNDAGGKKWHSWFKSRCSCLFKEKSFLSFFDPKNLLSCQHVLSLNLFHCL